jgi:hypothetical protein
MRFSPLIPNDTSVSGLLDDLVSEAYGRVVDTFRT